MPEHAHILVYPADAPGKMSAFLQSAKEPVARKAIRYLKANAPPWLARVTVLEGSRVRHRFWQPSGGYDRNITSIEALRAAIEWSSARWYAGLRPVTLEMDEGVLAELARG